MTIATFEQIPETALRWHQAGTRAAVATVIETWGSAPRPVGSQLVIGADGEMLGSVSGGCVEGAVIADALETLEDGKPRILEFGVTHDDAFAVGLACGGQIKVMVEPVGIGEGMPVEVLLQIVEARAAREAVGLVTHTNTWARRIVGADAFPARFSADQSGPEGLEFVTLYNPPLRMVIVGAVHIAQPLSMMARIAGYDVVLIDPREAFATAARFPDVRLLHDWPDDALAAQAPDARTAVVTLTHDPKLDDPAIETVLATPAFYLGCLGSKRTHGKRVMRLSERGFTAEQIDRIHGPVGADIGAKSPAEIAISIMAEVTERLRRPQTRR